MTNITQLSGVGPALASKLAKLHIHSILDLLLHLPYRYQDRTHIHPIRDVIVGDYCVIEGVIASNQITFGRSRTLNVIVHDQTNPLVLKFFHFSTAQQEKLAVGSRVRAFGEVRLYGQQLMMTHPEYVVGTEDAMPPMDETMTPLYPLTDGLTQHTLRKLVERALAWLDKNEIEDLLPAELVAKRGYPSLKEAIRFCHEPPVDAPVQQLEERVHLAQQRLIIEELLAHHLGLLKFRKAHQTHLAYACDAHDLPEKLLKQTGFSLTGAQQRVVSTLYDDMAQSYPMMRLLQGDVGSGKTIVAALAMSKAIDSGYQAALMAPTEILSEQHFEQFKQWFEPLGIHVAFLSGKLTAKQKSETLALIESGEAKIIIGTHALVQDNVVFKQLGFIVIDEQHRFGVHQRLTLAEKGKTHTHAPHQLIMTATPIPRTLAMTAYADLDYAVIDELPPGRTPVQTVVMSQSKKEALVARIQEACESGKQVYWVCTLIEESESLTAEAATLVYEQLKAAMPHIQMGLVHGKLKAQDKASVMQAFARNEVQLLIATTVIEVGVNVPNASLMVIENPERLGLSQLHQLRGRVGRGAIESHCVLLYQQPLSHHARERLNIMRDTTDGFLIAEKDLQLRGPGEWLGTRQTGLMQLKIANIVRDKHLLEGIKPLAQQLNVAYPQYVPLLINRWIGERMQYAGIG